MASPPLVLISGKDVLDRVGGHETYVRAHGLAAARLGFEPHIFCVGPRPRTTDASFGIVHHVPAPLPVALQGPPFAAAVARFLRGVPGPIGIHGFAIWAAAAALAGRAVSRRGVVAVPLASAYGTRAYEVAAMQDGFVRELGPGQRFKYRAWLQWIRAVDDRVEGWGYARSRAVLVNYESVARILNRAYGLGPTVRRIPYASEDAFDEPVGLPPERGPGGSVPLVLAVSRHDPRKGLDVLLRALAELAAEDVRFRACLVGSGALLESHRRLAAELGLSELVAIPGRVDDVGPYFAEADVFVLPSLAEASGSVAVLEALRAGASVVASACDGIPEDLEDGAEALLVPPGDADALAGALRRLLGSPELRARLAAGGRRAHDRRFSASRLVAGLEAVYGELGIL